MNTSPSTTKSNRLKEELVFFGVPAWLIFVAAFAPSGTVALALLFMLFAGVAIGFVGKRVAPAYGSLNSWSSGSTSKTLVIIASFVAMAAGAYWAFGGLGGITDMVANINGSQVPLVTGSGEMDDPAQLVTDIGRSLGNNAVYAQLFSLVAMLVSAIGGYVIGRVIAR